MAAIDTVKTALRITNSSLDDEITRQIAAARLDMKRVGVSSTKAESESDGLIEEAIVTYCLWKMTEDATLIDKYHDAYTLQIDGLRKCADYV